MRFCSAVAILLFLCSPVRAQNKNKHTPPAEAKVVTVPATIDHNRIIIDVDVPVQKGTTETVHAWVNPGNPDLLISMRVAKLMGLGGPCNASGCRSSAPTGIVIGDMEISFNGVKDAQIPSKIGQTGTPMAPGLNADIAIPSTVLRNYDVLADFPGHKFTIGPPGSIHFQGPSSKAEINPQTGLIEITSKIENKKYNLALDLGSSISFLAHELFSQLATAHPDWPHMTGAVGPVNRGGAAEETNLNVMRVDRVQYGPLFLTDVAMVDFPKDWESAFQQRAGMPTAGLLGSQALLNYRVGFDYAHSTVYFDIGRLFNFPDFDVVGLTLRPEDDGRFTILGIVDFGGKPSVPIGPDGVQAGDALIAVDDIPVHGSSMGQVWAMLGGSPGQERRLTIEREGKQFTVVAQVRHFLAVSPNVEKAKKKK